MKPNSFKTALVFLSVLFFQNTGMAQGNTPIKIKDFILIPDVSIPQPDPTKKYYKLLLKVDRADLSNNICFLFGSNRDSGNVLSVQEHFVHQGNLHFITYNGQQYPIKNYSVKIPIILPKSYFPSLKFLTVCVKSGNNLNSVSSNKLYYSFNP